VRKSVKHAVKYIFQDIKMALGSPMHHWICHQCKH